MICIRSRIPTSPRWDLIGFRIRPYDVEADPVILDPERDRVWFEPQVKRHVVCVAVMLGICQRSAGHPVER